MLRKDRHLPPLTHEASGRVTWKWGGFSSSAEGWKGISGLEDNLCKGLEMTKLMASPGKCHAAREGCLEAVFLMAWKG